MPEVTSGFGRQTIKYDRLSKTRRTVCMLACVMVWLVYLHAGKLVLLPKVRGDNDVMKIR